MPTHIPALKTPAIAWQLSSVIKKVKIVIITGQLIFFIVLILIFIMNNEYVIGNYNCSNDML